MGVDDGAVAPPQTHELVERHPQTANGFVINTALLDVTREHTTRRLLADLKLRLAEPSPHAFPLAAWVDAERVEHLRRQ